MYNFLLVFYSDLRPRCMEPLSSYERLKIGEAQSQQLEEA